MTAFDAIGAVLDGRYRLDAKLGEGGMGAVYRAHQLSAGRDVAVKLLHSVLSKDTALLDRFETEAKVIANLRHPNTLRLYDVGRLQDGRLFIVTELIEGESLAAYLAREPSLSRVLNLLRQVAEALSEAHERGVVHRDLKPANIMVERVGATEIAKVLDFGIAKLADQPKLTATGAIFGTPAYMSPEQADGARVDHRTDIYSLGVLLYEVTYGRKPFLAEGAGALLVKHLTETPPSAKELGVTVSSGLERLIDEMLAKAPDQRPSGMPAVAQRLAALATAGDTESSSVPVSSAAPFAPATLAATGELVAAPTSRRRATYALGAALIAGALGLFWLTRGPQRPEVEVISPPPSLETSPDIAPAPSSAGPSHFGPKPSETNSAPTGLPKDKAGAPDEAQAVPPAKKKPRRPPRRTPRKRSAPPDRPESSEVPPGLQDVDL